MQDFSGKSNYLSSSVKFFPNFCSSILNIKGMTVNNSSTANTINAGYFCLLKVKNNGWKIPDDVWNKKI